MYYDKSGFYIACDDDDDDDDDDDRGLLEFGICNSHI